VGKEGAREKQRSDFADEVRRVGAAVVGFRMNGSGSLRGGFEINVDPTNDPDIEGTTLMFWLMIL